MKIQILRMVEAAGVEPASEKARHEENYVRIRFMISGAAAEPATFAAALARLFSACSSGPKLSAYPTK